MKGRYMLSERQRHSVLLELKRPIQNIELDSIIFRGGKLRIREGCDLIKMNGQ